MVYVDRGNHKFTFHRSLYDNLMILKKAVSRDWDFKILISGDGMTRTGKTTIASQIGITLDPTFNLDRVIFRGDKLINESVRLGEKYGKGIAVLYDEAKEGLDSKKAMNSYSQNIVDYFSECGAMNQYLIIVLPEFFDLNKTVALNQSVCLINCYTKKNFERGYFGFFSRRSKRYLYIKGKKFNDYSCQKPTFEGTFNKYFPLDKEGYDKMKLENLRAIRKSQEKPLSKNEQKWKKRLIELISMVKEDNVYKQKDLAKRLSIDKSEISKLFNQSSKLEVDISI